MKKAITIFSVLLLIFSAQAQTRADYSWLNQSNLAFYSDQDGSVETVLPVAPVLFYDDFLGGDVVIPATSGMESGCKWGKKIVGSKATPTVAKAADSNNGIVTCSCSNSTSENEEALCTFGDQENFQLGQGLVIEYRARMTTLTTSGGELFLGLGYDWSSMVLAVYRVGVYTSGSGLLYCETDDNATNTQVSSGITVVANQWFNVKIDCSDVTSIKFYINGSRVCKTTTFAYADTTYLTMQPIFGVIKSTTGVGVVDVDDVRIWQNRF